MTFFVLELDRLAMQMVDEDLAELKGTGIAGPIYHPTNLFAWSEHFGQLQAADARHCCCLLKLRILLRINCCGRLKSNDADAVRRNSQNLARRGGEFGSPGRSQRE